MYFVKIYKTHLWGPDLDALNVWGNTTVLLRTDLLVPTIYCLYTNIHTHAHMNTCTHKQALKCYMMNYI